MSKLKIGRAFAPAAVSSFFEIHDTEEGKPIADLEKVGARGGGFGLEKGVSTKVTARESKKSKVNVFINSECADEARTTKKVVEQLLRGVSEKYEVTVDHKIEVPIGSGFGTSAGGALTAGLALKNALDLPLTYNQIGKIAHIAEIECGTGLGTVSSLTYTGGCVLVVEPGAPGICQLDRIPITPDYMVVAGFLESHTPKSVLGDPERKKVINRFGKETLEAILDYPTLTSFLDKCWEFSENAGFATPNVRRLIKIAKKAGAVGASQNMLGEAVHALVLEENAQAVVEAFKEVLPSGKVLLSKIDFQGARLIE
jgi:pantoate kinase